MHIAIVGAGAAGLFAALKAKKENPNAEVSVLEKTRQPLAKVKISGGGRCNVTHACFDPQQLIKNYPRGNKALLGPFCRFGPQETIQWFQERGVVLKIEKDGRMFPITDSSQTIINCLLYEAEKLGISIQTEVAVTNIVQEASGFKLSIDQQNSIDCDRLLLATGSARNSFSCLQKLGHTIVPPVPSLFTFNIENFSLKELAGISVPNATVKISGSSLQQTGPLLITHWGFSGPAVLKLSSWAARFLHDCKYKAEVEIAWLSNLSQNELVKKLSDTKIEAAKRLVANSSPFELPTSLWKELVLYAGITGRWAEVSKKELLSLEQVLSRSKFQINGQTTYKEEFVTSGGVELNEVNFKTMESKLVPHLYFAGEILNIDGVTGGFNFQNAWTTGWIAGNAMVQKT